MINLQNDEKAAEILLGGGVGILPTDTLYGIVARASDRQAVARMYALKKREHKPGTVIAATVQQLLNLGVNEQHLQRVAAWWPGSLSVETPLGPQLAYLHQGTGRQGFRVVSDARVRAILEKTGPLVTSSANQPGSEPANTVEDAYGYFGDQVDFYVDGGDRSNAKPSTIARITDEGIEVIRQGAVVIPDEALRTSQAVPGCPFCLANGDLLAPIVHQNDTAYLTTPAGTPGAYLMIPKRHIEEFGELPDTWWANIKQLLAAMPQKLESYNISVNYGEAAGQSIKHLHFWVVPRPTGKPSSGKGLAALVNEIDSPTT